MNVRHLWFNPPGSNGTELSLDYAGSEASRLVLPSEFPPLASNPTLKGRAVVLRLFIFAITIAAAMISGVLAADTPAEIKIGTLYASSGQYSKVSLALHYGLKLWIDQKNAEGGTYVRAFDRKIPLKMIAYDDESDIPIATRLYDRLISEDAVNILVADAGPLLTSPALQVARNRKQLLLDQDGLSAAFFTRDNPYIILTAEPVYRIWPKPLADFLIRKGVNLGIKRLAILYSDNEFTGTQAEATLELIKQSNSGLEIVFEQKVPSETSSYTTLLRDILASNPDAVLHFGYDANDFTFLRDVERGGVRFRLLFCIYPAVELGAFEKYVGSHALEYVFGYVNAAQVPHVPNFGMSLEEYRFAWRDKYSTAGVPFDFNSVAGYATGVVIERALATATSLDQLELRDAIINLSGHLKTLDGEFEIDPTTGAQLGESESIGQLVPDGNGHLKLMTVWPPEVANGKPIYPRP
jgi:branched-chain amino acid transport system substrate-binding protein